MRIRALKISINTTDGSFGRFIRFEPGLNIIRGDNTSGKSTIVSALIFSLGMEELLGGRNENVLQSALKTYLKDADDVTCQVIGSYVSVEIENHQAEVVTLKRVILSPGEKTSKLIEVIRGPALLSPEVGYESTFRYIHDPGSAQSEGGGYFRFLEQFLGIELPFVAAANGEAKLYIQTLFAALIIEQKSGWSDYIANIPYFRIRNASQKVFEFLVGMSTFENDRRRAEVKAKLQEISKSWDLSLRTLLDIQSNNQISIAGVARTIDDSFSADAKPVFYKIDGKKKLDESTYFSVSNESLERLTNEAVSVAREGYSKPEVYDALNDELRVLSVNYEALVRSISEYKSEIDEQSASIETVIADLEKNKVAKKLHDIGGELGVGVYTGCCPLCNQSVNDLLEGDASFHVMSIEENIKYLQSQKAVLEKCVAANKELISQLTTQKAQIRQQIIERREVLSSIRRDASLASGVSEAVIRQRIMIERGIADFIAAKERAVILIDELKKIAAEWTIWHGHQKDLPKGYHSEEDERKLHVFQKQFIHLAKRFGYSSAKPESMEIDEVKYIPIVSDEILRREIKTPSDVALTATAVKSDASASDFIRLIWAYIIALNKTSRSASGNHPGFMLLDEPAQHSMAVASQKSLFLELSLLPTQTIVAASFDNSDDVFNKVTEGSKFNLIRIEGHSIVRT